MSRPRKFRRVCCMPVTECFGPICSDKNSTDGAAYTFPEGCQIIQMSVDEYEAIRLMDLEGCTQEECARQMGISRTTVQGIYNDARKKLADALVHGKLLSITGGDYTLCENFEKGCRDGCRKKCRKKCHSSVNL
ncbi:DUF134 domain-containing protein [Aminipila luticellarii]|uniref:UPF0251 protein EQM06_02235 n=1 Tax=Aminipila luticellarii TaxID=2507160 RepID=A0A410PT50_9FIRM|nr:DUF134 domain-containing protein [Aminipila luticellarii]QAT42142.1 DUF134 domain-containing protein [Aminipila luticellarii]